MHSYELRRYIRCPKRYGDTIKKRKCMKAPAYDLDLVNEQRDAGLQKPLHERFIRNAAVLPELLALPRSPEDTTCDKSLIIHGYTGPDYQRTYHSVVDPLLYRPCGTLKPYSLELGFTIKEQLFDELAYPMLQISEQPNGQVEVTERFCVLRPTPYIDLDCEPE